MNLFLPILGAAAMAVIAIIDMLRVSIRYSRGQPVTSSSEAPYQVSRLPST